MNNDLIQRYAESTYLRAAIQCIPNFGGAIDTILYEKGSKWRQDRLEKLLHSFDQQINKIAEENDSLKEEINKKIDTEEFYNLFIQCAKISINENDRDKIEQFASILVNSLIVDCKESYEVELFINITKEINQFEINILSSLLFEKIDYYTTYNHNICDLRKYQQEYSGHGMRISSGFEEAVPSKYFIDERQLFALNRLERKFLITIEKDESAGSLPVSYSTASQSSTSQLPYICRIIYKISDFGKKYCRWIKSST